MVLGCPASAALTRRLDHAIRLYWEGAAPLLLLSGGGAGPVPEADIMQQIALAHGVPERALLVEPRSRNTVENAREAARLLRPRGVREVLLVSDRSHLPRAALLFRLAGLRVAGRAGVPPRSLLWEMAAAIRECAALPGSLFLALLRAGRASSDFSKSRPKPERHPPRGIGHAKFPLTMKYSEFRKPPSRSAETPGSDLVKSETCADNSLV